MQANPDGYFYADPDGNIIEPGAQNGTAGRPPAGDGALPGVDQAIPVPDGPPAAGAMISSIARPASRPSLSGPARNPPRPPSRTARLHGVSGQREHKKGAGEPKCASPFLHLADQRMRTGM
jgi:hypothetical protein